MPIEYVRTMKIKYSEEALSDLEVKMLAERLQHNGIDMHDSFCEKEDIPEYGFQEVVTSRTFHTIINGGGKIVFQDRYKHSRDNVFDQVSQVYKVYKNEYTETDTEMEWIEPKGNYLALQDADAEVDTYSVYNGHYQYENGVKMSVHFNTSSWVSKGTTLSFKVTWAVESVQRKEAIEEMVVATPLNDMGRVQKIFEDCLQHYIEIDENPMIDCHFDAKTESRSECAPDIIKMVRDARTGGE